MTRTTSTTTFRHRTPADLTATLKANPRVADIWQTLTPLAKNEWICYITSVKQPTTQAKHLARLQSDLLAGKRRPCCWPGCPHRRPIAQKWFRKSP